MNRRDLLKLAAGGMLARPLAAQNAKVRVGFIGVGARGTGLLQGVLVHPEVEVPVICDIDTAALNRALTIVEKARGRRPEGFSRGRVDYRRMLEHADFSAVIIATPQELHAQMAIDSMEAGKFVGSEVPACITLEECRALVKTQRKTRTGYMMLENYCYTRHAMQVLNMARMGVFGELTYAEGAYIHDVQDLRFTKEGKLTWRGENARDHIGNLYPTHAIGPVCQWLGINRSDRLVSLAAMASKPAATRAYAVRRFGKDSEAAKISFQNGDSNNALIRTEQGRLIAVRYDTSSPRPHGMGQHALQGTNGAYECAFGQHSFYLEGRSPKSKWEPIEKYQAEFDHPYWKTKGEEALKSGHGGGDYFVLSDFLQAVKSGEIPIDVCDAVTWTSIRPLSAASIKAGGAPVAIPDFRL